MDVKLHYALKALNNVNILRLLKQEEAGLDAVSIEEIHLGMRAGFEANKIMYTPNCVSFAEIQEAVELGVHARKVRKYLRRLYANLHSFESAYNGRSEREHLRWTY